MEAEKDKRIIKDDNIAQIWVGYMDSQATTYIKQNGNLQNQWEKKTICKKDLKK